MISFPSSPLPLGLDCLWVRDPGGRRQERRLSEERYHRGEERRADTSHIITYHIHHLNLSHISSPNYADEILDDGIYEDGPASRQRRLPEEGSVGDGPLHRRVSSSKRRGLQTRRRTAAAPKISCPDYEPSLLTSLPSFARNAMARNNRPPGFGKDRDLSKKFWSTKDPGQEPFTFNVGLGQVIKGDDTLDKATCSLVQRIHRRLNGAGPRSDFCFIPHNEKRVGRERDSDVTRRGLQDTLQPGLRVRSRGLPGLVKYA